MVETDLFARLNMTHSSYNAPKNLSGSVLPEGAVASGFVAELGNETP